MATQYALTQLTWRPSGGIAGTVTATITDPTGGVQQVVATTGALQNINAATAWFTPALAGQYTVVWASTGGQTETVALTVGAPAPLPQVMTLDDCYDSLKLDRSLEGSNPIRDADMLFYARAAVTLLERRLGPISPRTITEVLNGGGPALLLKTKPTAILSVTQNGQPAAGWVPDFNAAILYAGQYGIPWLPGVRNVQVVYMAGTGQVQPNVLLGIRELFRQLWERSRALGGGASSDMVLQGFAVPNAVWELVAGEETVPGFA